MMQIHSGATITSAAALHPPPLRENDFYFEPVQLYVFTASASTAAVMRFCLLTRPPHPLLRSHQVKKGIYFSKRRKLITFDCYTQDVYAPCLLFLPLPPLCVRES